MRSVRAFLFEHRWALLFLGGTWGLYFIVLFARIISLNEQGLWVGHPSVWSDWALHIGIVSIFESKPPDLWFAYHPIYADGQFTYPFLTNLISALLMRAGLSLPLAFIIPSIVLSLALLLGFYVLAHFVLKSQKGALLAISLFLLASGPGFLKLLSPDIWANWPTHPITTLPQYDWYTGNFIDGMLLPQRSFLLGLVIAIWSLIGLLLGTLRSSRPSEWILFTSGLIAGILPITHVHSSLVVAIIILFLAIAQPKAWRQLLVFALPYVLVSSWLYTVFIRGGIENPTFIHWQPFWTADNWLEWLKQWWLQWGLMIPVAIGGLIIAWRESHAWRRAFYLSFFAVWLLACFVLFQPVRWDNTKLFLWSYLGFSFLAVEALQWLWRRHVWSKVVAVVVAIGLTATGIIEVIRLQTMPSQPYLLSGRDDIELGHFARANTDPLARFLTAPQHNQAVMMWGARPILMGYPAWVWNFGFNYKAREQDIATMYQGGSEAEQLLADYDVSYVVIGPTEIRDLQANEAYFSQHFSLVYQNDTYRLYKTQKSLSQ